MALTITSRPKGNENTESSTDGGKSPDNNTSGCAGERRHPIYRFITTASQFKDIHSRHDLPELTGTLYDMQYREGIRLARKDARGLQEQ